MFKGFLCIILLASLTNYFSIKLFFHIKLTMLNFEKPIKKNPGLKGVDQFTHIRSLTGEVPIGQVCH